MTITDLRRSLEGEPLPEPLDPELLVRQSRIRERGLRRSRAVLLVVTGVVVLALGAATGVRAGWFDSRADIAGLPAASSSTASSSSPSPTATSTPSGSITPQPASRITVPETGPVPATPVPAVGKAPAVRTIPDNTWVEVVPGGWFATWQTNWVLVDGEMPTQTPKGACAAGSGSFGCRGTIRNGNIVPGFSNVQGTGNATLLTSTSVFQGLPEEATATLPSGATYWGVLWRLAGVPGWTFAVWTSPSPSATPGGAGYPYLTPTYRIYDAAGNVIGQYPS